MVSSPKFRARFIVYRTSPRPCPALPAVFSRRLAAERRADFPRPEPCMKHPRLPRGSCGSARRPGHRRRHNARLQGAQCRDAAFNVGAADLGGGELVAARRDELPGSDGNCGDQTKCCKRGASGLSGTFHAGFRPGKIGPSFSDGETGTQTGSCPVNDGPGTEFRRRHKPLL